MTTGHTLELREPTDSDWPQILELARRGPPPPAVDPQPQRVWLEERLAAGAPLSRPVPVVPLPLEAWIEERRSGIANSGQPRRRVAIDGDTAQVVGFVSIELSSNEEDAHLFVLAVPRERSSICPHLLDWAYEVAGEEDHLEMYMDVNAADEELRAFLKVHGFTETEPRALYDGMAACVLTHHLT